MNLIKTKILPIITLLALINSIAIGATPPIKSTNTQTDNKLTIPREIWPQNLDELLDYQNLDLLN